MEKEKKDDKHECPKCRKKDVVIQDDHYLCLGCGHYWGDWARIFNEWIK